MKKSKITSFLLILAMMISLISSGMNTVYASSADSVDELYKTIKSKFQPILNLTDMGTAAAIFDVVASGGFDKEVKSAVDELSTPSKDILASNGFITDDGKDKAITNILNKATDKTKITTILVNVINNKDVAVRNDILNLYSDIYDALPTEFKDKEFSKYGATKEDKIDVLLKLVKGVYDNGDKMVTEENGSIKIYLPTGYIDDANQILSQTVNKGENPIILTKAHEDAINVFLDAISKKINSDTTAKNNFKELSVELGLFKASDSNSGGSSGGSSGGGGGGGSSTTPTDNKVDVSKDSVEIKKEGKVSVASIKKEELSKSIQAMVDKMVGNKSIAVNIDLSDIKDLNAKISLPVESLKKLEGKEASVVIKAGKFQVTIPIKSLDLGNTNSSISLDVNEIDNSELQGIIKKEIKNVIKVVEFNLFKVEGTISTKIDSKFAKKVSVGIDLSDLNINKNKAAVLYVSDDNSTQVVGGKFKGSMIFANLEHFSKYAVVERDITFDDVSNHWSKDSVESMASKNIVNGYEDNSFRPENKVTRAEFAKLLVQTLELDVVSGNTFGDSKNHWAKDYIGTAYSAGLITGYDESTFDPDEKITRAQMATMIGRALETENKADLSSFKDSNMIPAWAKDAAAKAVYEELIKGDSGNFRPNDNTSRAEATTVVYRMFNK